MSLSFGILSFGKDKYKLPRSRKTPQAEKICLVYVSEVDGTGHSDETRLVCVSRRTVNTGSFTQ
ncbi:706_t:CDS:2, partial [Cetraspora pellucida]